MPTQAHLLQDPRCRWPGSSGLAQDFCSQSLRPEPHQLFLLIERHPPVIRRRSVLVLPGGELLLLLLRVFAFLGTHTGVEVVDVGLPPLNSPSLVAVADLDNDGWEDLIIGPGLIFKNIRGNGFENVSSSSNLSSIADLHKTQLFSSIAIADYDKDGLLDIYIYRSSPNPSGGSWIAGKMEENYETQLLRNNGEWLERDSDERMLDVLSTLFSDKLGMDVRFQF